MSPLLADLLGGLGWKLYQHRVLIVLAFMLVTLLPLWRRPLGPGWHRPLLLLLAVAMVAVLAARIGAIMAVAGIGHLQVWDYSIAAAATAWMQGQPLYPDPADGLYYGLLYGPLLFECVALAQRLFGIGDPMSALPLMLLDGVSLLLMALTLHRRGVGRIACLFHAGFGLVILSIFDVTGQRSEPLLLFLSAVGFYCLAGVEQGRMLPALGLGLAAGLSMAVKISAPIYFLPALVLGLVARQRLWRWLPLTLAGGLLGALLPYQLPGAGLGAHLHLLSGLYPFQPVFGIFGRSTRFLILLGLFLLPWRSPAGSGTDRLLGLCLLVCCLPVLYVASFEGAGPWHFLPFMPAYLLLLARRTAGIRLDTGRRALTVLAAVLLSMLVVFDQLAWTQKVQGMGPAIAAARRDLDRFLDNHPGDSVALAHMHYAVAAWPVMASLSLPMTRGRPLLFTSMGWIDLRLEDNVARIERLTFVPCRIRYFLTPSPASFTLAEQPHPVMLPLFQTYYEPAGVTPWFHIWRCRGGGVGPSMVPAAG